MLTRRQLLQTAGGGFGLLGLAGLLQVGGNAGFARLPTRGPDDLAGRLAQNPMAPRPATSRAKRSG